MNDHDYSPERLAARAEIQDVMYLWCRAVDRCDWETVRRDIFHPDGYDDHGIYRGNVDGMIEWLSERHKTISRSMHQLGNMLIEFADNDTALVETYSMALQRLGRRELPLGPQSSVAPRSTPAHSTCSSRDAM